MGKVDGIRSVDFKITAYGHGVVNWNGPTALKGPDGKTVENHTMPKLRGYTNLNGKVSEKGYKQKKDATDIDFKKTPLYISQNCISHHLYKDHAYDLHFATDKNLQKVLASLTGLIRGYVVASSQCKRKSALRFEDFVDELGNGNFEQFGRSGVRDSSSFFSKTTFGDTKYTSYGTINIEDLQFISLDKKFDRCAMVINDGQGEEVAKSIQEFISTLTDNDSLKPQAIFHPNYVRVGSIFEEGESGILLNNDAIQILVEHTLDMIRNLSIEQSKSYMYVDEVLVDYNDSSKTRRIKRNEGDISEQPESDYAVYYEKV